MKTILVVDDVKTDRQLIGQVVTHSGHQAEYASTGAEAIELAKAMNPAMIFMDVVMPNKDGFAACRALKKDPQTANIPIVLVTSKSGETDRQWAARQGANGFVTKPFRPEELSTLIQKFAS